MNSRKDYIELLAARMKEWDARIDQLRWKAEVGNAKMRIAYRKRLTELKEKRRKAEAMLTSLHEATDDAWKDVKRDVDRLLDDMKRFFKKAA